MKRATYSLYRPGIPIEDFYKWLRQSKRDLEENPLPPKPHLVVEMLGGPFDGQFLDSDETCMAEYYFESQDYEQVQKIEENGEIFAQVRRKK